MYQKATHHSCNPKRNRSPHSALNTTTHTTAARTLLDQSRHWYGTGLHAHRVGVVTSYAFTTAPCPLLLTCTYTYITPNSRFCTQTFTSRHAFDQRQHTEHVPLYGKINLMVPWMESKNFILMKFHHKLLVRWTVNYEPNRVRNKDHFFKWNNNLETIIDFTTKRSTAFHISCILVNRQEYLRYLIPTKRF